MAIDLTSEQKDIGKANFERAVGSLAGGGDKAVTRRDFMKGLVSAAAVTPVAAAAYFGYEFSKVQGKPVKAALIGAGDEGGVLVGEHNPNYLEFVAICDIRPTNQKRIFEGQPNHIRKGFRRIYGEDAEKKIQVFDDYKKMLDERKDIEAVVIALPLHLHAPAAIDCMKAGKHVLCEKLMAWNVTQCKDMIQTAEDTDRILAIGHQRHYSLLYAHGLEVLKSGVLGDIKHIRALWHRNNSWPADGGGKDPQTGQPMLRDSWRPPIADKDRAALESRIRQLGYKNMEELVRWRLYNRTGGGLMAELGSHQLDACSIFLGKVHPLAVTGYGGKIFYHDDREVEDHVFVTFEFPGKNYYGDPGRKEIKDKNDVVIVTYSSINTNSFEPYGECVMGTRGTLVVEEEQKAMLYQERGGGVVGRSTAVTVTAGGGGQPVLDASATSGGPARQAQAVGQTAMGSGPVSRGYREEMEHFAYCIRMHQQAESPDEKTRWRLEPRCHGKVAMADAIIALTANLAMKNHERIEFKSEWFEPKSNAVPDPKMIPEEVKA
ncbi:MAG: Gfo/Idh/MocA family oxidoreductase [Gemmataceae bacterium]|nr:Gfo/Idh/MocA family oxidoreductase [Gemmataceae bacterium]